MFATLADYIHFIASARTNRDFSGYASPSIDVLCVCVCTSFLCINLCSFQNVKKFPRCCCLFCCCYCCYCCYCSVCLSPYPLHCIFQFVRERLPALFMCFVISLDFAAPCACTHFVHYSALLMCAIIIKIRTKNCISHVVRCEQRLTDRKRRKEREMERAREKTLPAKYENYVEKHLYEASTTVLCAKWRKR